MQFGQMSDWMSFGKELSSSRWMILGKQSTLTMFKKAFRHHGYTNVP